MTANAWPQTGQTVRIRSGQSRRRRAEARIALLFVLPAIMLVLVFRIIPLFWGFGLSLTSATSTDPGEFIGAGNVPVAQGCHRPLARPLVIGTADGTSGLEGSPYMPQATIKPGLSKAAP